MGQQVVGRASAGDPAHAARPRIAQDGVQRAMQTGHLVLGDHAGRWGIQVARDVGGLEDPRGGRHAFQRQQCLGDPDHRVRADPPLPVGGMRAMPGLAANRCRHG